MFNVLSELNEDVVGVQLLLIATEQLSVEWKGTAWLASDGEIPHLLAGLLELSGIFDAHHGIVKWSGDVSLDLRLRIESNLGLFLEGVSNLVAADLILWEVV